MSAAATTGNGKRVVVARDWLPDLAAFVLGLALTWGFSWRVRDLVWSLWLSSLVLGYAAIVITIVRTTAAIESAGTGQGQHLPAWLQGAAGAGALFLLAFFTVHFGGFHYVHSVFLNVFFPVQGDGSFAGFGAHRRVNHGGFPTAATYLTVAHRYWPFLLATAIAERRRLFGSSARLDLTGPYRNVVRLHGLIFFFAAAAVLHLDSFLVYAVVFAVYFFPTHLLRRATPQPDQGGPTQAVEPAMRE